MIVMSLVFSHVFNQTESYPVFILTNLVGWNFFSQATSGCMNSMLWGSDLFQRSYLPKTSFIISSTISGIINLLFSLVPLAIIMAFSKISFNISLTALPIAILILACFALGIGLLLSSFVVIFPDLSEMYPVALTAWMYLTPIIVPEEVLQSILNGWLLKANPLYYILRLMSMTIYEGIFPTGQQWLIAVCIALFTLLLGWFIFTKRADTYGYRV